MTRNALAAVLLLTSLGCASSLTGPAKTAALGQPLDLGVGESARISDQLLELRFDGVGSDSRCPIDVVCIQAGDAELRLTARRPPATEFSLNLHTELARSSATFQGFEIALLELRPHPKAGEPIMPSQYVATLKVTRP